MTQRPSLRAKALALLAIREYSRQELARKLATHACRAAARTDAENGGQMSTNGGQQATIDALLDEFAERGWLSEARYIEQTARRLSRRYGPRKVAQDLLAKGVARESIAASMPYLHSEALSAAKALLERKFREPARTPEDKARRVRFLQGRGFDYDVIRNVLKNQRISEGDDES